MGLSIFKAVLIIAYFMHLRFERLSLVLTLMPALVMCICLLGIFFPDSIRMLQLGRERDMLEDKTVGVGRGRTAINYVDWSRSGRCKRVAQFHERRVPVTVGYWAMRTKRISAASSA